MNEIEQKNSQNWKTPTLKMPTEAEAGRGTE